MAQLKAPCKNCKNRVLGCHSTCEKYKEFYELNEQRKAEQDKAREIDLVLHSYNISKTYASKIDSYGKKKHIV